MAHSLPPFARPIAAGIAVFAFATLAVQTMINQDDQSGPLAEFFLLFRFFTIWSNFAAGVIMVLAAMDRRIAPWVLFALATALTQVGLVYHALLAADHHPIGLDWWTNLMFHTVVPLSVTGWWLVFSRSDAITWRSLPKVMIAPVIYTAFALIYGEMSGFYPYFFLDLPQYGWVQILLNILGLALFFMLLGAALLGLRASASRLASGRA